MSEPTGNDHVVATLERTLASRAAQAPAVSNLAARARAGRRRLVVVRSSIAVAVAFGVAIAVAVPTILLGSGDGTGPASTVTGGPGTGAYSGLPPVAPVSDGWRWETYGGVELQVPVDWSTGGAHGPWCLYSETGLPDPYVNRPGPVRAIGCAEEPMDRWVPYVDFLAAGPAGREDLGSGWARETRQFGDVFVAVRANDAALLDTIVASERAVTDLDANGCPFDYAVTQSLDARPTTGVLDPQQVGPDGVVCQYAIRNGAPAGAGLAASYRLTADEVRSFVGALAAAPIGGGPSAPENCLADYRRGDSALVVRVATTDGVRDVIVWYAGCVNGADDGVTLHALTADLVAPLFHGAVFGSSYDGSVTDIMPPPGR